MEMSRFFVSKIKRSNAIIKYSIFKDKKHYMNDACFEIILKASLLCNRETINSLFFNLCFSAQLGCYLITIYLKPLKQRQ